ncbi:ArsR/SmtB family transcription factor [Deinococcus misasensis]|uniref:ArsR/SmtB family transcription factor n=1 Tax=Deinococcus misasensis TaxID=392413 RepID=UPI0006901931|nr:metalloregulator ArsR/SmtB family transcription factor [Deinococcus misasensis]
MSPTVPLVQLDTTFDAAELEKEQLEQVAWVFKALSDPMRLKILLFLHRPGDQCCGPETCACDLEEVTGLTQPTVSHHMKCLISAGLVSGDKRGKWMYYRINPSGVQFVQRFLPRVGG